MTIPMPADLTDQWMRNLHNTIETLLADLDQRLDNDPTTPSGQPYDGCLTCQIRETLAVAVPTTVEATVRALSPETPPTRQQ